MNDKPQCKKLKPDPGLIRKIFFILFVIITLSAGSSKSALAQEAEPPEEPRLTVQEGSADQVGITAATPPTGSAGIATGSPNGPHSTYAWPMVINQMGHLIQSYQNYGSGASGAYFHHGIDMITNNYGVNVYAVTGGQVVNVQNYNSGSLYWEVAILDPQGYVWQYHHVDYNTIPQAIKDAYSAWQANHTTGGFIAPNTYIGKNVQWPTYTFGYYFHHIHLNILAAGDIYLNPLEFLTPGGDTQLPEIQQIGLLKDNTMVAGNTISGSYGLYVRARDLYLSPVYYLPPYKYEFSIDGGPWTTLWEFHDFPGGANDYTYVNDFFVSPPTDGDYTIRDFVIDLGFTTSGQRTMPAAPGLHNIIVRVADYNGNQAIKTYTWSVNSAYENTTSAAIGDNGCGSSSGVTRTFTVSDAGAVTDVNLGLNLTHASRGHIQVTLKAPGDASATALINPSSDTNDNYDLFIDDSATSALNDNSDDNTAAPSYELDRTAGPGVEASLDSFNGKSAAGTWTLFVCDGTSGTSGTLNKVRLDISTLPLSGSAIGSLVWLDEDRDGRQDTGEAGLPDQKVELCSDGACSTILRTTFTDAAGGYLFKTLPGVNLLPGSYTVRVTPSSGLSQTYDENSGLDNLSQLTLTAGAQYLSADFGYIWSGGAGPNAPTAGNGVIGDQVWIDANGNGLKEGSEIGLAGVTVELVTAGADGLFGGADDLVAQTTSSGPNGSYVFAGLPAGAYLVRLSNLPANYTQTGDPDQYGAACTACDGQTTVPLVLSPTDVFVNADFGYRPADGTAGAIGDAIWLDSDRMNDVDAGELRLAGVTVSLIRDLDGDGTWDSAEPIIASAVTDKITNYLFSGLPVSDGIGSDDYLVWVNDANNVLGELVPVYDGRDGFAQANPTSGLVTGLTISAVSDLAPGTVSDVDFGFVPFRQDTIGGLTASATTLDGLIGDTIWLDSNVNGALDAGEGLEGVSIKLFASGGTNLLASTISDENGQYFFAGLNPAASYVVQVQTATLPYTGLTNFIDPDGGSASQANVTLTSGSPVNQAQDFGYRDASSPNTISGTVWNDLDADGALDAGETGRFAGVNVALTTSSGKQVALASTNASGGFSFANLPDGTFKVHLSNPNHIVHGMWKSTGANPGSDGNSQVDPYSISVSGGLVNPSADFGFFYKPAALGDYIWFDEDSDGVQDASEGPQVNLPVDLTITWPDLTQTVLHTRTDANGRYSFGNLLQDEGFDGVGAGEPLFTLSAPIMADLAASPVDATSDDLDSDGTASGGSSTVTIGPPNSALSKGYSNKDYDLGFAPSPTALTVSQPVANPVGQAIEVKWQTYSEMEIIGFALYRAIDPAAAPGGRELLSQMPARHPGQLPGSGYQFLDSAVQPGVTYTYWLVVQMKDGTIQTMEPASAGLPVRIYLPSIRR